MPGDGYSTRKSTSLPAHLAPEQDAGQVEVDGVIRQALPKWSLTRDELIEMRSINGKGLLNITVNLRIQSTACFPLGFALPSQT